MERPTVDLVKGWSRIAFDALDAPYDDGELGVLVERANTYVENTTGRRLDSTMPTTLDDLAQHAVQLRTEQLAYWGQEDYVETGTDDLISSFSAGPYSETRRDTSRGGQATGVYLEVNPWPPLNSTLWQLMTDDKRDEWREVLGSGNRPAFETTEVDWHASSYDPTLIWGA